MKLTADKTPALLALLLGPLGAHRFYFRQYKLAAFYLLLFVFVPWVVLYLSLVDGIVLLFTRKEEWLGKAPPSFLSRNKRRMQIYGLLPFFYFGTQIMPLLPADNFSNAEGPQFYKTYSVPAGKLPLFYRPEYNISFWGLEKMHPFDSKKYGRIHDQLVSKGVVKAESFVEPPMLSDETLRTVHPEEYLESLRKPMGLLKILELPVVAFLPWQLTHRHVLTPMRFATSGSMMAARAAMEKGWAINFAGGYHHASSLEGGGFCVFADITLAIRNLRASFSKPLKVMIIDLDAHQGNGHERDFTGDADTFIVDMYNPSIYPNDTVAKQAISLRVHAPVGMSDEFYLEDLKKALAEAADRFSPDFILYNAGTDIMSGDNLGLLDVSADGIRRRDELVFRWALKRKAPIMMVLSGGYQKTNAPAIADSIENLLTKVLPR